MEVQRQISGFEEIKRKRVGVCVKSVQSTRMIQKGVRNRKEWYCQKCEETILTNGKDDLTLETNRPSSDRRELYSVLVSVSYMKYL